MTSTLMKLWAFAEEAATKAAAGVKPQEGCDLTAKFTEESLHAGNNYWMPVDGSTHTAHTDWLFYGILALTFFCFIAITVAVVYFVLKYRRRPGHEAERSSEHNDALEITWTIIPSIICVFIFIWGWEGFVNVQTTPKNAMEIQVTAQKWEWLFKYPNGWIDRELHVPVDEPVRLVMRSEDVLHSFYVPAFRTKQDVIPYRYTKVWFEANKPGTYRLFCTEYCGDDHSRMKTVAVVHEPGGFEQWLSKVEECALGDLPNDAARGEFFYENRGCKNCHSVDGTPGKGPTFKGLWGKQENTDKGPVTVDENYIRESLLEPAAVVVTGYGPIMPTFKGKLTDEHIGFIIEYIKSLK